jgi:multidrug efflux system membrane fusion protein
MIHRVCSAGRALGIVRLGVLALCLPLAVALIGCEQKRPQLASEQQTAVPVSQPIVRQVTDFVDFTGRTDAIQSVDIRARVTGFLVKMPFEEGAEIREGDLLFEIDPRPYKAQLDQALSQISLNEASLELARTTYERDRSLARTRDVSQQQLDQDVAALKEAQARVRATQASTEVYNLNLGFTRVTSPISGQVSRHYLSLGNLVQQDNTLLTTVVSLDPMYAYFDMDEPTLLRIRRAIRDGRIHQPRDGALPVLMGLQGEEGYPHQGKINFVNNQVNPTTGSISIRGVFPNPHLPGDAVTIASALGHTASFSLTGVIACAAETLSRAPLGSRLLSPGMFVRIRFPIGQPYSALLVIDRAIATDQGLKYVFVVDGENTVQYRRVTTGPLQPDGLRVIRDGLKADDWVITGGQQQVRAHMTIRPEKRAMPSHSASSTDESTPSMSNKAPASSKESSKQKSNAGARGVPTH